MLVDGTAVEVKWSYGAVSPEPLSAIAIFDAKCARAYIDEQGDFSYVPYGLDILSNLAQACNRLKNMLSAEQAQSGVDLRLFAHLANLGGTAVAKLIASLSSKTKPPDVEVLATLSEAEIARHSEIDKSLKEGNPKEKAQQLRLRSGRLSDLADRCAAKAAIVSDSEAAKLKGLVEAYQTAKAVADVAAKQFRESPGQLPGTGGEAWQKLFDAARAFALESHPGKEFPHLGPESQCPLCQQTLGDAATRLEAFDAFIQQEAEKTSREKQAATKAAYDLIDKADLSVGLDAALKTELAVLDEMLAKACEGLTATLNARRDAIKAASSPKGDWGALGAEPENPGHSAQSLGRKVDQGSRDPGEGL